MPQREGVLDPFDDERLGVSGAAEPKQAALPPVMRTFVRPTAWLNGRLDPGGGDVGELQGFEPAGIIDEGDNHGPFSVGAKPTRMGEPTDMFEVVINRAKPARRGQVSPARGVLDVGGPGPDPIDEGHAFGVASSLTCFLFFNLIDQTAEPVMTLEPLMCLADRIIGA